MIVIVIMTVIPRPDPEAFGATSMDAATAISVILDGRQATGRGPSVRDAEVDDHRSLTGPADPGARSTDVNSLGGECRGDLSRAWERGGRADLIGGRVIP